ncbi:hypothetical protein CR205_08920 [Alteribacter lacisalsi]|uniref:DUF502 domain-containing protein n=1 Tax=Alteribacter lacisalsi TaxID=2045244 RepID=A0A2W0HCT6_9BACI|nr:DUF502 domain-containing protein [Alteribacter lacisalsi]PYZ98681.1 hypothetical protein CR205_08920 [Alteribacter lacisalsi]
MWKRFQRNLVTGFLFLLPAIATIYVLQLLFSIIDNFLGPFITDVLRVLRVVNVDNGTIYFLGVYTPFTERLVGFGFIFTVIFVAWIGAIKQRGNKEQAFINVDRFFRRIPVANYIYGSVDQVINAFTQERSSFQKVVMVEYPRKGVFTLGFLTGETKGEVQRITQRNCINVFLPTTPNPTSGWLVIVPLEDVTILHMSVEEGLKFIISGGVVVPPDKAEQLKDEFGEHQKKEKEKLFKNLTVKVGKQRKDEKHDRHKNIDR